MKKTLLYGISLISIVLLILVAAYARNGFLKSHDTESKEHSFLDVFEVEQATYPSPETIDKTGSKEASFDDEFSTSTAHVTSHNPVAGYVVTATSSTSVLRVPVMIYHSVRPHVSESSLQDAYDITPELLAQEIEFLKVNGYTCIRFSDLVAAMDGTTTLPAKPVILSFDDGWENQYVYAFPILKKYKVPGTFFIYTNPVGRNPHWMTWSQIVEMDRAGMEIGGHSRTHPYLTKIIDNHLLDKEIAEPKAIIEAHIGHPIYAFAYPFGFYNARVVAAVKRAGYVVARNVFNGVWQDAAHRYEVRGALSTDRITDFERYLKMP